MIEPVLRWTGSKALLAPWIVERLPASRIYCEPFGGSLAVLFAKPRSRSETVNDLDGEIVNLFRVLRDRGSELIEQLALTPYARGEFEACAMTSEEPVERARRFMVRAWQTMGCSANAAHGGSWRRETKVPTWSAPARRWGALAERIAPVVARLQGVQIEQRPALELIDAFSSTDVLLYCDPPYPWATRKANLYRYEMSDEDHEALLDRLEEHPGPVVLSGYDCELYARRMSSWLRCEHRGKTIANTERTEVLWLNPRAARAVSGLFLSEGAP